MKKKESGSNCFSFPDLTVSNDLECACAQQHEIANKKAAEKDSDKRETVRSELIRSVRIRILWNNLRNKSAESVHPPIENIKFLLSLPKSNNFILID